MEPARTTKNGILSDIVRKTLRVLLGYSKKIATHLVRIA